MDIILVIVISFYFLLHLIYYLGVRKSAGLKPCENDNFPSVSVIVAAKNEEKNIASCIRSLKNIDYPREKLEIILVNDNSVDATPDIMRAETGGIDLFKVLTSGEYAAPGLKGKTKALSYGIEHSSGEIILTTDADCIVKPGWVKSIAGYYGSDTGMVNGISVIETGGNLFYKLQALDWIYLLSLASSSTGLGMPLACIGNNMSYTRKAYEDAGGYSGLNFSVTEDLALMRAVKSKKKYGIKLPVEADGYVLTKPCKNVSELASQKRRWFRGGTGMSFLGYLTGLILYSSNAVLLTGFLYSSLTVYLFFIAAKIFSELMLILPVYRRLGLTGLLPYYLPFQLYFAVYGLLLPLTFISGAKIKWKGVEY